MFNNIKYIPSSQKIQLSIILITYIFLASVFGFAHRYIIDPDGVSYLRLAGYIAEGNFQRSVTGYWSPLISWCMAPFLFLGIDGLITLRIVMALWGIPLVISIWLLASRFNISNDAKFIVMLIATLIAANWSSSLVTPDLLLMTLILFYLYVVTNPNIFTHKKISFLCGIIGGVAYLSKHYALPFFLVHFPLMLILMKYTRNKGVSFKAGLVHLVIGLIGFLMISSPWISLMSSKYQRLTISSSGNTTRAIAGPFKHPTVHRSFTGLHKPDNDYAIHTWEDPTGMDNETWSPFENKKYFIYQLKLSLNNILTIIKYFISNSFVFGLLAICCVPVAFLRNLHNPEKGFLYGWSVITVIIYCSGYIISWANQDRYFLPVMMVSLLLSFHFFEELKVRFLSHEQKEASTWKKYVLLSLFIVLALSFSKASAGRFLWSVTAKINTDNINHNKELAEDILTIDFPEPYVILNSDGRAAYDLYWAYYLKKQLLGRPVSGNLEEMTRELEAANAKSLIVFNNPAMVKELKSSDKYIHRSSIRNNEINIFILKKNAS